MAGLAREAEPEHVVADEQERRAETLDLQRPAQLDAQAVPDTSGRQHHERQEDRADNAREERETGQCLPPACALPHVGHTERNEHHGKELRRDPETEQSMSETEAVGHERCQSRYADRGGPEIEPAQDHRPEEERSDRGEAEGRPDVQVAAPEYPQHDRHRQERHGTAHPHERLERAPEPRRHLLVLARLGQPR